MNLLEKYRTAWQKEPSLNASILTDQEIRSWLFHGISRTDRMYRKGIIFDLIIKGLLVFAVIGIVILFRGSQGSWLVSVVLGVAVLISFLYEWKIVRRIPHISSPSSPTREMLQKRISFFNRSYLSVLFLIAISSPVMMIIGGMYYFYFKYGEIRPLDLEDIIVFSLFILAGYCISAFFQLKHFRFHTRQLEETLSDLDHGTITMDLLKQQQRRRIRVIMLTSLAIATGVFMFLLLFLK